VQSFAIHTKTRRGTQQQGQQEEEEVEEEEEEDKNKKQSTTTSDEHEAQSHSLSPHQEFLSTVPPRPPLTTPTTSSPSSTSCSVAPQGEVFESTPHPHTHTLTLSQIFESLCMMMNPIIIHSSSPLVLVVLSVV
jgi:hypothetical protein